MSNAIASYKNIRVSGKVTYTPAYTKPGTGVAVAQKVSIPCIVNNPPYVNDAGKLVETEKVMVFITAWGKMADTCAKYLAEGKEFSCDCNINSYQSKIIDPATKRVILNSAGQPCVTIKQGYTMIPSSFVFGNDSANQIAKENRGDGWNGQLPTETVEMHFRAGTLENYLAQAKQQPAMWAAKRELLKKLQYTPGMKEFGEALVVMPEGVAHSAYQTTPLPDAVANACATPTVDGFTYKQMTDAGWTDAQLLQSKYAALVPKVPAAVPTPPPMDLEATVGVAV